MMGRRSGTTLRYGLDGVIGRCEFRRGGRLPDGETVFRHEETGQLWWKVEELVFGAPCWAGRKRFSAMGELDTSLETDQSSPFSSSPLMRT